MLIGIEAERANAPQKTGVEHYAQQLILQFAQADKENGYILYLRTEPEEWIKHLPKNFSYKVMPFPIFWTQLRLSWEMLLHRPDVLFVPASAIPIISPKKTVCTIHDSAFLFYPETFTPFMRKFLHYSYKFITWKAWKIIVPSKASKDDLVKYYHTDPGKIQVIHHGYTPQGGELKNQKSKIKNEEERSRRDSNDNHDNTVIPEAASKSSSESYLESSTSIDPGSQIQFGMTENMSYSFPLQNVVFDSEAQTRGAMGGREVEADSTLHPLPSRLNLPPRFVLFLSTLQPRKNLEGLIDAMKFFREKHPEEDVKLIVAGRVGWKAENVLKKIEENKDFVLYLNHVTDEERAELYQKAQVFCVPSFYEGFGMWILEAFDVGLPVITSNISSMPEVGGEAVEYCDPHSTGSIVKALENVLLNPQRKTQLRELGLERLKEFSWEKCERETLEALTSVFIKQRS